MYVLIDKVNTVNKGAELMLVSIMDRLKREYKSDISFILDAKINAPKEYKCYKLANIIGNFFPKKIIEYIGFVRQKDINVVLNAAGFYFSDQWNWVKDTMDRDVIKYVNGQINYFKKLKKYGSKIILLPQAFGPFNKIQALKTIQGVIPHIDVIYARDSKSYQYLVQATNVHNKIYSAPDFTSIYNPIPNEQIKKIAAGAIIIIPNSKMLTNTTDKTSKEYTAFLEKMLQFARTKKRNVVLLNHEGIRDKIVIEKIYEKYKNKYNNLFMLSDFNANDVKYAIKISYVVFSSRFHGLASALSQNIPALCSSWSHKYEALLEDYDFSEAIVDVTKILEVENKFKYILDENNNSLLRKKLKEKAQIQKNKVESMWIQVIDYINYNVNSSHIK